MILRKGMFKMKKNEISLVLSILSFLGSLVAYPFIPNKIPHFNMANEIDSYSGKWSVFILALLPLGMFFLMQLISKIDKRNEKNSKTYEITTLIIVLVLIVMNWVLILVYMGINIDLYKILDFMFAVMFFVIGNYMPRVKMNSVFGIRTSWTLSNEKVWSKTHRFGGFALIAAGIASLGCIFINGVWSIITASIILSFITIIICIYSYIEFEKAKKVGCKK